MISSLFFYGAHNIWKLLAFDSFNHTTSRAWFASEKTWTVSWTAWDTNCYNLIDNSDSIGNATWNRNKKLRNPLDRIEFSSALSRTFIFFFTFLERKCIITLCDQMWIWHVNEFDTNYLKLFGRFFVLFLSIRQSHKIRLRIEIAFIVLFIVVVCLLLNAISLNCINEILFAVNFEKLIKKSVNNDNNVLFIEWWKRESGMNEEDLGKYVLVVIFLQRLWFLGFLFCFFFLDHINYLLFSLHFCNINWKKN